MELDRATDGNQICPCCKNNDRMATKPLHIVSPEPRYQAVGFDDTTRIERSATALACKSITKQPSRTRKHLGSFVGTIALAIGVSISILDGTATAQPAGVVMEFEMLARSNPEFCQGLSAIRVGDKSLAESVGFKPDTLNPWDEAKTALFLKELKEAASHDPEMKRTVDQLNKGVRPLPSTFEMISHEYLDQILRQAADCVALMQAKGTSDAKPESLFIGPYHGADYIFYDLTTRREKTAIPPNASGEKNFCYIDLKILANDEMREALANIPATLLIASSGQQRAANEYLRSCFTQSRIVLALPPDSASAGRMFGCVTNDSRLQSAIVEQFARVKTVLSGFTNITCLERPKPTHSVAASLLTIMQGPGQLFVVIAHNENGMLRLPDGSELSIEVLTEHAKQHRKMLIIISCDTAFCLPRDFTGVASIGSLDPEAAAQGIMKAEHLAASQSYTYLGEYLKAVETGMRQASPSRVKLILVASGSTVAMIAIPVIIQQLEKEKVHK